MIELDPKRLAEAEKLASQRYSINISEDSLSNGEMVYLLEIVELPGCMAHGKTMEEAMSELRDAATSYIYYLLEDGLEVPKPLVSQTTTGAAKLEVITNLNLSPTMTIDRVLDKMVQPDDRQNRMTVSVIEGNFVERH
jgi:predicted RNase H-like HicB family nuclease